MGACWRCGSPSPPDSSLCPACGRAVGSDRAGLDVLDESISTGSHVEAERDATSPWLIAVAFTMLIGLIGFFVAVGGGEDAALDESPSRSGDAAEDAADEPEPAAEPPTTTTTELPTTTGSVVGTLVVDDPMVVDGHPIGLAGIGDTVLAFVAAESPAIDGVRPSDVSIWELDPGGGWLDRGVTITGAAVTEVAAEPAGLVAVGIAADGRPTAWRSVDGIQWDATRLHEGTDHDVPFSVVSVDGLTVVAARPISAAPETAAVWDDRGNGWRLERLEQLVDDLHPGPPGEVLVATAAASGSEIVRFDGVTWFGTSLENARNIERWRGGFVAPGPQDAIRVFDADLELRGELVVPGAGRGRITHLAADTEGLAVTIRGAAADPGEPHTEVSLAYTADGESWYEVHLPPGEVAASPETMQIAGDRIVVASVIAGDGPGDVRTVLTTVRPETPHQG